MCDILNDSCDSSVTSFSGYANSSFIATEAGYDSNDSKILTREMSVMTDLSFSVNADVSFSITDFISPINTAFDTTTENELISTDEGENTTDMSEEEKDYEYIHISTESDSSTGSENIDDSKANDMDNDMKFIVFFSCLVPLLQRCHTCNSPAVIKNIFTKGTALCVKLLCHNNHLSSWCSQPQKGATYLGNLLVAASIVFSGGTYKVFSDMANILLLQMINSPVNLCLKNA